MDINKIKAGNRDEWDELVEGYADIINGTVFKIVNNKEMARDICQETFLRSFKRIRSFTGNTEKEFLRYLFTAARNQALNEIKRRKKVKQVSLDEPIKTKGSNETTRGETFASDTATPLQEADKNEQIRQVHQAIEELSKDEQVLYALHYVQGLKY